MESKPEEVAKPKYPTTLLKEKNIEYLTSLDKTRDKDSIGFFTSEHLKVSALY